MNPLGHRRPQPFTGRSQIAVELMLFVYSVAVAFALMRLILLALGIDQGLWIGRTFFRFTDPFVDVLARLPGADRVVVANVTLPDVTLVALLFLVPLAMIARGKGGLPGQ